MRDEITRLRFELSLRVVVVVVVVVVVMCLCQATDTRECYVYNFEANSCEAFLCARVCL